MSNPHHDHLTEMQRVVPLFEAGHERVDHRNLGTILRALGGDPDTKAIEQAMDAVDREGLGSVNLPEYLALMRSQVDPNNATILDDLHTAFRMLDTKDTGMVPAHRLTKLLTGDPNDPFTVDDLMTLYVESDIDRDGPLIFEDFVRLFMPPIQMEA